MDSFMESILSQRMGEPLEKALKQNTEYQEVREIYEKIIGEIEEKLLGKTDANFLDKMERIVGRYSVKYGEAAYMLGFHDGLEVGLEHKGQKNWEEPEHRDEGNPEDFTREDMTDLIFIYDAYWLMDRVLFGGDTVFTFGDGAFVALSRVGKVIGNHMAPSLREGENPEGYQILQDTFRTPEERAGLLMAGQENG